MELAVDNVKKTAGILLADLEELQENLKGYEYEEEFVQGAILDIDSIIDNVLRVLKDVKIEVKADD